MPYLCCGNGDLYNKEDYLEMLKQKNNEEIKFKYLDGHLSGYVVVDQMTNEFELWINLKNIFKHLPLISYEKFINADLEVDSMIKKTIWKC